MQHCVKPLDAAPGQPNLELRGFERVPLPPREQKTVNMVLTFASLAQWDAARNASVVQPGSLELLVGASFAELRLSKTIQVQ